MAKKTAASRKTSKAPSASRKKTSKKKPVRKKAKATYSSRAKKAGVAKTGAKKKAPAKKASSSKKAAASKASAKKKVPASKASPKAAAKKSKTKATSISKSKSKVRKKAPARSGPSKSKSKSKVKAKSKKAKANDALFLGTTHDDLYSARLVEDLEFRHGIDVSTLDIGVRDGKAEVRGLVSDEDEAEAIKTTVQEGGGITELEFIVQIAPTRREISRDLARLIQDVLDAESDLAAETIQVACLPGKVILRGTTASAFSKHKAAMLALRQEGITKVRNRIVISDA